ncbi:MAG: DUF4270 domain-containing protein [Tannerellaceae bacterium]|jgi:hypothetical protein|nr:DUF4270 domain-containing protein [Tannerellaceae bacterium]
MKTTYFIICILFTLAFLSACDNIGLVGSEMQPKGDMSVVYADTFQLEASTVALDSTYAKSTYGLLGEMYDPTYGTLKSGYLCQFYCQDNFKFKQTPLDGKIDSMKLYIAYERGNWIGDSLAPMQVKAFPLIKQLSGHFYTNFDPVGYVDMQHPLAELSYTPRDFSISDSIWNLSGLSYYYPDLSMRMPTELGQAFYDASIKNPGVYTNQQTFNNFFPGLYITNTFGSGNIIVVETTGMAIYYRYQTKNSSGNDTILTASEGFLVTEDVIQLNQFRNTDISTLLTPNDDHTYIKTPAGVFTRVTIPIKKITDTIKDRKINNAYFSLTAFPHEEQPYTLTPPNYLLALPEDSVVNFFRDGKMDNSTTSFVSMTKSAADLTYRFGNISIMLDHYMRNAPEKEELNLLIIPIERTVQTDQQTGESLNISTSVKNYLRPSGLKLRKGEKLQFQVISSRYND